MKLFRLQPSAFILLFFLLAPFPLRAPISAVHDGRTSYHESQFQTNLGYGRVSLDCYGQYWLVWTSTHAYVILQTTTNGIHWEDDTIVQSIKPRRGFAMAINNTNRWQFYRLLAP